MNQPSTIYGGQFALLRHWSSSAPPSPGCDVGLPSHWDLLLETDSDLLLTWCLDWVPDRKIMTGQPPVVISGKRLNGHRRLYLDYEGPISGDRGCVRKVMTGGYRAVLSGVAEFRAQWLTDLMVTDAEANSESCSSFEIHPVPGHYPIVQCQPLGKQYLWILLSASPRECLLAIELTEVGKPVTVTVRHWSHVADH